jgi:polyferredoxin
VVVGIGRSGNFRKLGVPGEDLDKVYNRLHDPQEFCDKDLLVVGGGDSAMETAIALTQCGANVTLSYRKPEFSRPKPENIEKLQALAADPRAHVAVERPTSERVSTATGDFIPGEHAAGSLRVMMSSRVKAIRENEVTLQNAEGEDEVLPNDVVFSMIGREAPLDFFRRSGVNIRGLWQAKTWASFLLFFGFCVLMYHWKAGGSWLNTLFQQKGWFPFGFAGGDPSTLWGSVQVAMRDPGFYYSMAYCLCVVVFGIRRIRRRRTPYVRAQTLTLMAIQVIPLFLLPYILLPWMGHNGVFESGLGKWFGDTFFPGGSYWRAFGFILAWPLFIWNVFTEQPVWGWLVLSLVQTFVIIPLIIYRWGKGAYCGWICSCGALAETLGDAHRHKMPHGPLWNRMNMVGQGVLLFALVLLVLRIVSWAWPDSPVGAAYTGLLKDVSLINYKYLVDLWFAGIIGVGLYFHFSGRVWCRFACPLAALMHIYARFSQFRILADKKKCISCNVCTSVCHQGIDIMNFANKGLPMEDPQCVRCSACVQSCPTGVLEFGRVNRATGDVLGTDRLPASSTRLDEA